MYYDFYCDEQMLLDNFSYYGESNRLLKRLVAQSGNPPDTCADLYLSKMDNRKGLYYDRYDLIVDFEKRCTKTNELKSIHKIVVYKQDVEYVKCAIKEYRLTEVERMSLFGIIMMCRILNTDTVDLTTQFKIQQFCSCFGDSISAKREIGEKWYDSYHSPVGLKNICDKYHILLRIPSEKSVGKIGCSYVYFNYELNDKTVVAEYDITKETNKLNLERIFRDLHIDKIKYCECCGKEIYTKSNRLQYCKGCSDIIKRERTKERVRKHREKKKM